MSLKSREQENDPLDKDFLSFIPLSRAGQMSREGKIWLDTEGRKFVTVPTSSPDLSHWNSPGMLQQPQQNKEYQCLGREMDGII